MAEWCCRRTFSKCDGEITFEGYGADLMAVCEHGCMFSLDGKDDETYQRIRDRAAAQARH